MLLTAECECLLLINVDHESEAEDDMLRISRKGEVSHLLPLF
jgi:hypothetical protein